MNSGYSLIRAVMPLMVLTAFLSVSLIGQSQAWSRWDMPVEYDEGAKKPFFASKKGAIFFLTSEALCSSSFSEHIGYKESAFLNEEKITSRSIECSGRFDARSESVSTS